MTVKEWLNRARVLADEINTMYREGPGEDAAAARTAIEAKFNERIAVKMEIINAAYHLTDRRERIALIERYCDGRTISEISQDLSLSWFQAHKILMDAIRHLGEVLGFG